MEDRRKHVEYGFVAYTGVKWTNDMVDSYNRYQDRLNACLEAKGYINEELLNGSHNLFQGYSLRSEHFSK